MSLEQPTDPGQHTTQLVGCRLTSQSNRMVKPDSVTRSEVFQAHGCQVTIGNGHNGSIQRPDARRTKSNVFHRSKELAYAARIPHVDGLIRNHHDAAEQV